MYWESIQCQDSACAGHRLSDVTDTVRYQSLMSLWELIRHKTPVSLWNRITLTASDRRTNLQYLRTSKPRIKLTTDSWRQQSIIDWNKLPLAARTQLCKNKFRSSARTWDANNVPIRAGIRLFFTRRLSQISIRRLDVWYRFSLCLDRTHGRKNCNYL